MQREKNGIWKDLSSSFIFLLFLFFSSAYILKNIYIYRERERERERPTMEAKTKRERKSRF